MELENFDGRVVRATVPVKFLKSWIQSHYADALLECCGAEFEGVECVDLSLRQPGMSNIRQSGAAACTHANVPEEPESAVAEPRPTVRGPFLNLNDGHTDESISEIQRLLQEIADHLESGTKTDTRNAVAKLERVAALASALALTIRARP